MIEIQKIISFLIIGILIWLNLSYHIFFDLSDDDEILGYSLI